MNGNAADALPLNGMKGFVDHELDVPALRLRLLCPHSLVPALIGKKGDNIKRIRRESGATVSVADPVMGCDERVVHIIGESVDADTSNSAADALCAVFSSIYSQQQQRRGELPPSSLPTSSPTSQGGGGEEGGGGSGSGSVVDGQLGGGSSAPSTVGEQCGNGVALGSMRPAARPSEVRLLVDSSIVGFIVGRGGATIKDTMQKTGAGLRIMPKAELPACACMSDEVVRVAGSVEPVHAALRVLAGQIKAHNVRHGVPRGSTGGGMGLGGYAGGPAGMPMVMMGPGPGPHSDGAYLHPSMAAGAFYPPGMAAGGMMQPGPGPFSGTAVEVTFRLLAPVSRTGNIIGKGGEHVRRVRIETGARIKVFDPAPGSEERVVALTSSEDALSAYCAAQDALIRCVIALSADDNPSMPQRVRLLTAQSSVGMVLGKRGATVSQLRQETGASIKVLSTDPVPPTYGGGLGGDDFDVELGSMSSNGLGSSNGGGLANGSGGGGGEEVIQVDGSVQQCVAALRGVATLLRGWQIRKLLALQQQQLGGAAAAATAAMLQQQHSMPAVPVSPTAGGVMSPPSPGILGLHLPSSLSSPAQPSFLMVNGMHSAQQQHHQQSVMLPPGVILGPPLGPPPPPPMQQRGVTYIYRLDNAQVGAVLGKGGAHIAQIRSMSGARVQLQGESEGGGRVLMVAGQPEQCHAAHTMANAFLSMGRCEPAFPEPILGG